MNSERATERCARCRRKLENHGKGWIDSARSPKRFYICPTGDGMSVSSKQVLSR